MKKLLISSLIFAVLFSISLNSRIVEKKELTKVSMVLIQMENLKKNREFLKGDLSIKDIVPLRFKDKLVGYLISLNPEGFMISPGITELFPCKYISFSGTFNDIKNHPFIKQLVERIYYTRQKLNLTPVSDKTLKNVKGDDEPDTIIISRNERSWEKLQNLTTYKTERINSEPLTDAVAPMLTSTWSQGTTTTSGNAYNMYTPTINDLHTYTGCSATAQAQVMYYWKFPASGQGSHSYTWYYTFNEVDYSEVLSASFAHAYNWGEMVNNYNGGQTSAQEDAVGRLMVDVGYSINMQYGLSGSGAVINRNNSLNTFFKYSSDVTTVNRSSFANWDAWFFMFQEQMDFGWPAILATFKPGSGHAVVIDGYRTDPSNQVHVNLGWGGFADGYYTIDDIYGYGNATSDYSVINIYPPGTNQSITVTSPNGGEDWQKDSAQTITWTSSGVTGNVIIQLYQGGISRGAIYNGANTGSYSWTIDNYLSGSPISPGTYKVQVKSLTNTAVKDQSDGDFTISPAAGTNITVTSPNGGEDWQKASAQTITWTSSGITGNVIIQLYQGTVSRGAIYNGANTGSYSWTIDNYLSGSPIVSGIYEIQVKSLTNPAIKDRSDGDFTISPAAGANITVTSPNGGENWQKDSAQTITWTSSGITGNVIIQLYQGGVSQGAIYNGSNTGSYSWTIDNYLSGNPIAPGAYKVQVKSLTNSAIKDQSDGDFTISPAAGANITVTSPNGGENWQKDSAQTITWTSSGITGNVIIQLYQGGVSQGAIYNGSNTGSYSWTIDNYLSGSPINTGSYKVQVKSLTNTAIKDQSDGDFTISPAAGTNITVTSPNGGENWVRNSTRTVTWTSSGITGNVIIQLYQGGVSQGAIYNGANTGSFSWTIDNYLSGSPINTGSYKLQVKSLTNTAIKDQSNTDFNITSI